ncbi:MAG: MBL fold metallo-hydrolase [Romboutsia sp.]|uniref:MBL fold metallo-hydrolase n=1 Tax=Romboutsia sp. TaxID=1965302 RepID=UPI00216B91F6|nr:MBL fold metallo-hydrolase [Romboutsia sp.]MCI9258718.1 MBL fold metallo-hydrolase [Romboutsia sp.]
MIIEMFPAENGDAFLVRLDNGENILIDMGYNETYNKFIKNRLIDLKNENQCINLLVITHIDEDHIEGAIEFFRENGYANKPNIIEVKEIWYNSYRHLQFNKEKVSQISRFEKRKLEEIKLTNSSNSRNIIDESVSISAKQGSTLAGYLYGFGYVDTRWNTSFNYKAINLDTNNILEFEDMKLHILSPNTRKLKKLADLWINKLVEIDIDFNISDDKVFDDAYEMYMKKLKEDIGINENNDISYKSRKFKSIVSDDINQSYKDQSKSNGSSISFILEYKGKRIVFLGDAHEDIILENLERYIKNTGISYFDVVKISHHGSLKNNFNWIEKIKAKRYLISTNGRHKHPDKEVIAKILQCNSEEKIIYFNYYLDLCKELDDKELKDKYNYSIEVGDGKSILEIEVNE